MTKAYMWKVANLDPPNVLYSVRTDWRESFRPFACIELVAFSPLLDRWEREDFRHESWCAQFVGKRFSAEAWVDVSMSAIDEIRRRTETPPRRPYDDLVVLGIINIVQRSNEPASGDTSR